MKRQRPYRPGVAVAMQVIAMFSIQGGASLAKELFPIVGAQGATALRLGFAALLMVGFWRPWRRPSSRSANWSILASGLALGAMNLFFYLAIASIPQGIAVALEFVGPLAVASFGSKRLFDMIWVGCALVGVLFLLPDQNAVTNVNPTGLAFALAAGGCWAAYIVCGKKAVLSGIGSAVAYGTVAAAVLTVPFGLAQAGTSLFSIHIVPLALAVAVLTSAIPYSLEMIALDRLSTREFGILASMEPALASISGLWFLGEQLSHLQVAGIVAIMAAAAGAVGTRRSAAAMPA